MCGCQLAGLEADPVISGCFREREVGSEDRRHRPAHGFATTDHVGFQQTDGGVELPDLDRGLLHGAGRNRKGLVQAFQQTGKARRSPAGKEIPAPQNNTTRPSSCI